jgi:NADH dehydrogenase FAD-containing subunit
MSSEFRIVIVGGGFGGLWAAHALQHAPVRVTVIDRRNHHLFQPLLYQVATAGLSPADIAVPIRSILRRRKNLSVLMAEVTGVDRAARVVETGSTRIAYDALVIATGTTHAYFGHDEWRRFAPGLKSVEDALFIRRRLLLAFEEAEAGTDAVRRAALLTFIVVGGGPTGVELAGAIAELAHKALARDFRHIDPQQARIVLLEAGPRLLASFPDRLAARALRDLESLGVEVRLDTAVESVDEEGVVAGGARLAARTVLWAAGVAASPAARWLGADSDRAGRVKVEPNLAVPGAPEIFVIGDTALVLDAAGNPLPGVAPVAKQEGTFVARLLSARARGAPEPTRFAYRNAGNLATIGRNRAVVDFGWLRLTGFAGWLLWAVAHIFFLIGFRSRLMVATEWAWSYITFGRGARLITGG